MHGLRRRLLAGGLGIVLVLTFAGVGTPSPVEAAPAQTQRAPRGCDELQPLLRQVGLIDTSLAASLPSPDGAGMRACVFLDHRTGRQNVWLPAATTVEQFRAGKTDVAGQLAEQGIDLCALGFWSSASSAVQNGLNFIDAHDSGRTCEPVVEAHGPRSEAELETVRTALAEAVRVAEDRLGWRLTWPLQVQVWDDDAGIRARGDLTEQAAEDLAGEAGMAIVSTHGHTRIVLDLSKIDGGEDLRAVVAHEFGHIVQHGLSGCSCTLPFWAIEGGAEFFAAQVVGPHAAILSERFQEARERRRTGAARPLATLADRRTADQMQAYSRGYAAMLFLGERWGSDAITRLYHDNLDGTAARFLARLEALTGFDLDGFETELNAWLAAHTGFLPVPAVNVELLPGHALFTLSSGALVDDTFMEQHRFGPGDRTVAVQARWNCLTEGHDLTWTIYAPDDSVAATSRGQVRAGCFVGTSVALALDTRLGSATPRSRPGLWRVEVALGGRAQGAVTFTIES